MKEMTENSKTIEHTQSLIADLEANFSIEHFRFAIQQCLNTIAELPEDDDSPTTQAKRNIVRYANLQLRRASAWAESEADLLALVLRSLIELKFWAIYVRKSAENCDRFMEEQVIDARELFERIESPQPPELDTLKKLIAAVEGKRVNVIPTGEDENLFWKLCSKMIHPSSVGINNFDELMRDDTIKRQLALRVIYYAWVVIHLLYIVNFYDPDPAPKEPVA